MTSRTIQLSFFFVIFGITAVLGFFVFRPYLNVLVLAGTFAIIFYPLYKRVLKGFGNKWPSVASFITVILATIIVFVPLTLVGNQVLQEASIVYESISNQAVSETGPLGNIKPSSNPVIREIQSRFERNVVLNFSSYAQTALTWFIDNAASFFQGFAQFVLAVFLWFLSFYYFMRDGERIKKLFIVMSPLSDRYDVEIVKRIGISVKSVVGGSLIVAILQGFLTGVGLAIFGVPAPFIWGAVAVLSALVPSIGTALVLLPAISWLLLVGQTVPAIGLLVWAILIVGPVDNILRPKLIERQIQIHPLVILLSVLGGIAFFGPVGFLIGPIIISLLSEFVKIYQEMVVEKKV